MSKLKVEYRNVADLNPYGNNPRLNDGAVDAVAASIKEFGFKVPIVVDSDGVIVTGHTRLKAAKKLGLGSVPVIVADDLSPEQVKAFRLADNKTAELAEWDLGKLDIELNGIDDIDMSDFGFDDVDLGDLGIGSDLAGSDADEDIPEPPVEPVAKMGDVYRLGDHILMCGDSTKPDDVHMLMSAAGSAERADLLITDPPYNVNLGNGGSTDGARERHRRTDGLVIANDAMADGEFYEFLLKFYKNAKDAMREGAAFYVWYADSNGLTFRQALKDAGLQMRENLIWVKNTFTLGRQDYQWRHEPCLYGWKDGASHSWHSDRKQSTVLEFDKPSVSKVHPTMKPVELFDYQIRNSSAKGDIVLDLFGGSGTTIIACEENGRRARVMEFDPKYVDVIVNRWEQLTGGKAEKLEVRND